jgi:hypothetical protein
VFRHPLVFLILLAAFLGLVAWLLPKLFRFLRGLWSRARERDATLGEKPP